MKPTIVFVTPLNNLGSVIPQREIALACADSFSPVFLTVGRDYKSWLTETGFPVLEAPMVIKRRLAPDVEALHDQVRREVDLWEKLEPAAIVSYFLPASAISARVAGIPLYCPMPFAWSKVCFEAGYYGDDPLRPIRGWAEMRKYKFSPEELIAPFNKVAGDFVLRPFTDFYDVFSGDINFLNDIPELTGVTHLPENCRYVGPIIARDKREVPEYVRSFLQERPGPIIYFTMGSSSKAPIVRKLLAGFAGRPDYQVVASIKEYVKDQDSIPDNVLVTDWLPSEKMNMLATLSLTHGGLGTLQTASLAGKPIVGIGMHPEQEVNLQLLQAYGCAEQINREAFSVEGVLTAVDKLLNDEHIHERTAALKADYLKWGDGAQNIATFLAQLLSDKAETKNKEG